MLIVVGLLMYRASDPRNWVWLTGEPREESRITEVARHIKPQGDEQIAPGPTDLDQDEREAAKEQYQAITDHTQALGREEMPAYWRLFNWAEHQSLAELERRADGSSILNQFMQSPDEQRGKLFKLDLNVRRVLSYDAPANSAGIKTVYEVWGWTTESKAWLYVVLTAHLPPGMPQGPNVNERVTFAGYFLKVQGYQAAGAAPQDKPLAAPLLIGRLAWVAPPAQAGQAEGNWMQGAIIVLTLLGAIGLAIWFVFRRQTTSQRVSDPLNLPESPRNDIQNWLANAEEGTNRDGSHESPKRFHSN